MTLFRAMVTFGRRPSPVVGATLYQWVAIAFYGRGAVTSDADIAKFLSPDSCIGALRSRTYSKYVNEKKFWPCTVVNRKLVGQ